MTKFDSNDVYFLIIGIVSGFLIIKKLKPLSVILILVSYIIGYSITSNVIIALSVSLILGNLYVSLNKDVEIVFPGEKGYELINKPPIDSSVEVYCDKTSCKTDNIESTNIKRSINPLKNYKQIEKFSSNQEDTDTNDNKGNVEKNDVIEKMSSESDTSSIDSNGCKDDKQEYFIDTKGSFMDNYKSLSKKQLKGLNKDTKNLIETQKQLIETLNNMGPALKDGKQILDSFKDYFGNESKLGNMLSNMKL